MNLIVSRRIGDSVQLFYAVLGKPINEPFCYEVERTVIGLSFPQPAGRGDRTSYGYAALMGERAWYSEEAQGSPSRQFVVLDEAESASQTKFYEAVIALKDRYLCRVVVCPDRPNSMAEHVRDMEGLTRYSDEAPVFLKSRYPTYVSRKTVAHVVTDDVPPDDQMIQFRDMLLSEELRHPEHLWPMLGASGRETYRLAMPGNLKNEKARTGIQSPSIYPKVLEAVYLAAHYMETTRPYKGQPAPERKGNPITGY